MEMTNLSDLPHAMLTEIAKRLKKLEDYTSFRSVSRSLRPAAKKDYFEGLRLRQHTPYMMLPANVIPGSVDDYSEIVGYNHIYLLRTIADSLLLITRSCPNIEVDDVSYITTKFQAYDLDVVKGTWKEIYSLGNMAVFLGHNSTTFVDASRFPGVVKANHIYFTDDNWPFYGSENRGLCGGYDSGVYNFETGTVEPVYPGEPLLSKFSPSFWITPCF